MVTYEEVRRLFDYDPKTGNLTWKNPLRKTTLKGCRAGCLTSNGYRTIGIYPKIYREHRIIFLWYYGYTPENDIDHINGIRDDNRISNLREYSDVCNRYNARINKNNTTGVRGVVKGTKRGGAYRVMMAGKYIGTFWTLYDAACARYDAEQELGVCTEQPYEGSAEQYIDRSISNDRLSFFRFLAEYKNGIKTIGN